MKPRSKRNRKRPRGGVGCLLGDTEAEDKVFSLKFVVLPMSKAFDIISDVTSMQDGRPKTIAHAKKGETDFYHRRIHGRRRVRIILPYPFTFATFAKARWVGRTIADVYSSEFGSYPRTYYEAAINAGRILVSGKKVDCGYKVRGGDQLSHIVHRHEPAVGLANAPDDIMHTPVDQPKRIPPIEIVHEDEDLLVVDKPPTLPVHPCGGYNANSLFEILSHWKPDLYGSGKLFTIHRLDRLTSGLLLIAKNSALASCLGKSIMQNACEKIYLARVKGKFPLNLERASSRSCGESTNDHPWKFQRNCNNSQSKEESRPNKCLKFSTDSLPPCQYGEIVERDTKTWTGGLRIPNINLENNSKGTSFKGNNKEAGLGYWVTDGQGVIVENASLQDLIGQCDDVSFEEMLVRATGTISTFRTKWLHFSCPCRIASHKNGICEAGDFSHLLNENERKGIKPAQTSFTPLSYDSYSDTSLIVAKPVTGRTHQIRLHLQKLGHPIANDHCYGGELLFGDEEGKIICEKSREWLDQLDRGTGSFDTDGAISADTESKTPVVPKNSTNADTPATETEVYQVAADRPREEGESILDFIEKTCVWCARCRGMDYLRASENGKEHKLVNDCAVVQRTLMEYFVRSQGIWLHALEYNLKAKEEENGQGRDLRYRTRLPSWATITNNSELGCRGHP